MTVKKSRIPSIIGLIICFLLVPILIVNLIIIIKGTINPETPPSVLGITPLVILSGSMDNGSEGCITTGDLVFSKKIDPDELKKGDIISFMDGKSTITHRIVDTEINEEGETVFVTKGDANNTADKNPVKKDSVIGIYILRIPKIGDFALFMQTGIGMMCFIGVPLIAFILYDFIRRHNYTVKKEKITAEMEAEIERLKKLTNELQANSNKDANI